MDRPCSVADDMTKSIQGGTPCKKPHRSCANLMGGPQDKWGVQTPQTLRGRVTAWLHWCIRRWLHEVWPRCVMPSVSVRRHQSTCLIDVAVHCLTCHGSISRRLKAKMSGIECILRRDQPLQWLITTTWSNKLQYIYNMKECLISQRNIGISISLLHGYISYVICELAHNVFITTLQL